MRDASKPSGWVQFKWWRQTRWGGCHVDANEEDESSPPLFLWRSVYRCYTGSHTLQPECAGAVADLEETEGRTLMKARRYIRFVVWLLTLAAGIGVGTVIGQQSPPMENKGLDAKVVSTVDLTPDMPGYLSCGCGT
jgi:hypothetical protein